MFGVVLDSWNHPFIEGGWSLSFWNFSKKGASDFSHKKGGVGKIRWVVLKKGVSLTFLPTKLVCVLFIYTISISILCVSREEGSLTESNQQIYDFYKWVIFEKQRHCRKWIFDISELFI